MIADERMVGKIRRNICGRFDYRGIVSENEYRQFEVWYDTVNKKWYHIPVCDRVLRITRSGYLYVNGRKVSPRRVTPFYFGQDCLTKSEQKIARKWAYDHYKMVNN